MKKILLGVTIFVFAAGLLIAGGKQESSGEPEKENSAGPSGTLNAMAFNWSPGNEMEKCFAQFTEDTGIKVNLEIMDYGVYYQTVGTRLTGGGDTDIMFQHAAPFFYPNAEAGLYIPMEEFGIDTNFLFPVVRKQVMGKDGKTYLIPAGQNAMLLLINNKIMEENGFEYPTSWDDWMDLCQEMVDKGIVPLYSSFPENNTRYIWFPLEATKISFNEPDFWEKAKAGQFNPFADPRWAEMMKQIISMWENNYIDNDLSPVKADSHMMFGEGEAAMMLTGTWSIGALRDYQAQGLDYRAIMIPCNDSKYQTNVAPVVAAVGWAAAKNTKKFELVKAFQLWWVENVKNGVVNEIYGWPPCVEGAPFELFENTGQTQIFDYFKGPASPFTEAYMPSIEMIDYVDKELQSIFLGENDLDKALKNMQQKWDEIMEK